MKKNILHIIPTDDLGGVQASAKSITSDCDININVNFLNRSKLKTITSDILNSDIIIFSLWKSLPILLICKFANTIRIFNKKKLLIFFFHSTKNAHFLDYLCSKFAQYITDFIFADSLATKNLRIDKIFLHKFSFIK